MRDALNRHFMQGSWIQCCALQLAAQGLSTEESIAAACDTYMVLGFVNTRLAEIAEKQTVEAHGG